jgi:tRNA threonylcarbamoyladenosine biosynthesis protein TsaB
MALNILALDTSSDACSVALLTRNIITENFQLIPRQHNALILPMIEQILGEAGLTLKQLDAIAFGRGPGSFTGLRIAASVVQGIAFAADLPVLPISTLQALAQAALREFSVTQVIAAIDARINEIYWAAYQADANGLIQAQSQEIVCAPHEINWTQAGVWQGAGSGWDAYHAIMQSQLGPSLQSWLPKCYVKAQDIVKLAEVAYREGAAVDPAQAIPIYLRDQVVKEKPHG